MTLSPGTSRCPACGAEGADPCARADVAALAACWRRDPTCVVAGPALEEALAGLIGARAVEFFRCRRCGLERARPDGSWTSETYPRQDYYLGFDHAEALRTLDAAPPRRVLELGCGDGRFLAEVVRRGHAAVGLDFVPEAVTRAQALGLDARIGDVAALAAHLPPGERFDVVALFQVLEHLAHPGALLAGVARVTAPGARLLLGVPAPDRFSRAVPHAGTVHGSDYWDWPPQHVLRWNETSLRALLGRHGWEVEDLRTEPFSLIGAAASLAAIDGLAGGWYGQPRRRRLATARILLRLAAARARRRVTGIRLFASARRR